MKIQFYEKEMDAEIEGRYLKGNFWRSKCIVKWCGKDLLVTCFLSHDHKNYKLSTPDQLKSLNWLLDNFDSVIKGAFKNEEVVSHLCANSASDFTEEYFKDPTNFRFYCAYSYLDNSVEIDMDVRMIKYPDQGLRAMQLLFKNGHLEEVRGDD